MAAPADRAVAAGGQHGEGMALRAGERDEIAPDDPNALAATGFLLYRAREDNRAGLLAAYLFLANPLVIFEGIFAS